MNCLHAHTVCLAAMSRRGSQSIALHDQELILGRGGGRECWRVKSSLCIHACERERRWFERRWFVLERPRRDTNGGSETEVTVTSELQANAERDKEIEKRQRREEKAASFGGAGRGSVPENELIGEGARHSEAESEGGRRPECPG